MSSSHAFVVFDKQGVDRPAWDAFCAEEALEWAGDLPESNVWRKGGRMGVEAAFGAPLRGAGTPDYAEIVTFTTDWGGYRVGELARLARAFWMRFGGAMFADEQIRRVICRA